MNCRKCGFSSAENFGTCPMCFEKQEDAVNNVTENNSAQSEGAAPQTGYTYDPRMQYNANANNNYGNYNNYNNYNAYGYQGGVVPPYQGYYPNQGQYMNVPDQSEKAPSLGDYLKWMLLYPLLNLIPFVGTIIYIVLAIVHATDKTKKGRANYFKATLISMSICLCIVVIFYVVLFAFLGSVLSDPEAFYEEMYPYMLVGAEDIMSLVIGK